MEWTQEQIDILMNNYRKLSYAEVGAMIGKSKAAVSQYCFKNGIVRTREEQKKITKRTNTTVFRKGEKPWNTGTKGVMKPNATSYQKGNTQNKSTLHEGAITYNEYADGKKYKKIKIKDKDGQLKWILLHRYNWEQIFGPIPEGHVIIFKDGDTLNCEPTNLECITRAEKLARETAYVRKKAQERRAFKESQKNRPPAPKLHIKKRAPVQVSNEIPLRINEKTVIYIKPGQDIEAIKARYASQF